MYNQREPNKKGLNTDLRSRMPTLTCVRVHGLNDGTDKIFSDTEGKCHPDDIMTFSAV